MICKKCGKHFYDKSNRHVQVTHAESEEFDDETEEMEDALNAIDGGEAVSSDDNQPKINM